MGVAAPIILSLALAACSTPPGGGRACEPGHVEVDGACHKLCTTYTECDRPCDNSGAGESCDPAGFCVRGCPGVPEISSIDGNGGANGSLGHAPHFAGSGLVIAGRNLFDARVRLTGAGVVAADLAVAAGASDERIEVCLPDTLDNGPYSLTIANQAGEVCGDFELVQGIPGPPGEYASGTGILVDNTLKTLTADVGPGAGQLAGGPELAALQSTVAALQAQVAALQLAAVPIGGIIAWHKSLDAGVGSLPDGYLECNGQTVSDAASPLDGVVLPDLNGQAYAGGRGRYLRGGNTSGLFNNSSRYSGNGSTYAGSTGPYFGACYGMWYDTENGTLSSYTDANAGQPNNLGNPYVQVTAMTVVFIMRVR